MCLGNRTQAAGEGTLMYKSQRAVKITLQDLIFTEIVLSFKESLLLNSG